MNQKNLIQEQYGMETTTGDSSPLSTGSSLVVSTNIQDHNQVKTLLKQIDSLQVQIRRLSNKYRDLQNEVERLRNQSR